MTDATTLVEDDRLFWEIQRRYQTRPMVCGVYLALAGPPDRARLETLLLAASQAHPRLGLRLLSGLRGPRWHPLAGDPAPLVTWEHDASLRDHSDFLQRAASRMNDRLPADGLAWQCRIVSDRPEGDAHGRVHGLFIRWQHALTDGEGMLDFLAALCAAPDDGPFGGLRARNPALAADRKPVVTEGSGWTRRGGLRALLEQRRAVARSSRAPGHPGGDAVEIRRIELPLRHEQLVAVARRHGVSTNDVTLCLSASAIERYRGATRGESGAATILSPVSRRRPDDGVVLGNHSQALRVVLDPLPSDLRTRITRVGALSAAAMASATTIPYWVYAALFRLPRRILDRALASAPPYLSNYLPWCDRPQRIAGQAITAVHGFAPLLPYHGCTFAYGSYAGSLTCALFTDPTIVADAPTITSLLQETAHELARVVRDVRDDRVPSTKDHQEGPAP